MIRGKSNSCGPAPYEVKQLYVSSDCKGLFKRMRYYALYAHIFSSRDLLWVLFPLSSGSNHHLQLVVHGVREPVSHIARTALWI